MINKAKYFTQIKSLYKAENELKFDEYLQSHNNHNTIYRQLDVIEKYLKYIPKNAKILDWGCYHSPDFVVLKDELPKADLHACDFFDDNISPIFHQYSQLKYTKLTHNIILPYDDNNFDVVLSSGVLEHVAMDYESLKEIYRILKPNGILIISFLPNHYSYTEWITKNFTKNIGHFRKYSLYDTKKILIHTGYYPLLACFHQFIPSLSAGKLFSKLWFLNKYLEKMIPFKYFCSNIMVISKKVQRF